MNLPFHQICAVIVRYLSLMLPLTATLGTETLGTDTLGTEAAFAAGPRETQAERPYVEQSQSPPNPVPPNPRPQRAPICSGYEPSTHTLVSLTGPNSADILDGACPDNFAYFAALQTGGRRRPGAQVLVRGSCCPLPYGILTNEHEYQAEHCPAGSVATGFRQLPNPQAEAAETVETDGKIIKGWSTARIQLLRCTKIDQSRFALAPPTAGYETGWAKHFRTLFEPRTSRSRVPVALRYGLGRAGLTNWHDRICLPHPWGSVLVGKTSKYCSGMLFSEIRYRDPKTGEASKIPALDYSYCLYIKNPLAEQLECGESTSD